MIDSTAARAASYIYESKGQQTRSQYVEGAIATLQYHPKRPTSQPEEQRWQLASRVPIFGVSFYRIHAGSFAYLKHPSSQPEQHRLLARGRGGEMSTQREQLWAVGKAARGEGATLQALAATRSPTEREHL